MDCSNHRNSRCFDRSNCGLEVLVFTLVRSAFDCRLLQNELVRPSLGKIYQRANDQKNLMTSRHELEDFVLWER